MTDQQRAGEPGAGRRDGSRQRRPTMADVANHLGVSRALVSIVFRGVDGASDATRQRVFAAAAELGYRPDSLAQGLRRNRSRNLGVLFSLRRPFEVELVEHMYPVARHLGYDLLLGPFTPGRGQDVVVDELLRYRCAGLVVVGPELHARDLEPLVEEVAVVEVGRGVTRGPVDVIRNDDAIGARQAVDHLVALGHREIAYVDGGPNPGAEDRRAGYRAAMTEHGLAPCIRVVSGGYTEDEGAEAARALLSDGLPTAVIAANDPCAIGILDTVLRDGATVPGTSRSSATTTPGSAGFPGSTSPPSGRTSPGWPGSRSRRSSSGSTDPPGNRATSPCARSWSFGARRRRPGPPTTGHSRRRAPRTAEPAARRPAPVPEVRRVVRIPSLPGAAGTAARRFRLTAGPGGPTMALAVR